MANKTIKGLTVEIGGDTTQLGKALDNVNKQSQNLSGELNRINKLLKLDPGNADLLAQKQKVLANAVEDTGKKLEILREAEKQVQEQFKRGEVSEAQVRELQREIIATTQELKKYERQAEETAETIERLGEGSEDVADTLDQLGDDSKKASKAVEDVGDESKKTEKSSQSLADTLEKGVTVGLLGLVGAATAAIGALAGCVEATEEYRRAMGKLETAFDGANFSAETAQDTYEDLQSVLGDTDQAVEAASHLAKLAKTEEDLGELTHALTGVYATFGDSLPLEGLAEAANETAKVGKVTGSFADAINWAADANTDWKKILGNNTKAMKAFEDAIAEGEATEDAYTAALEACSDEQERQQIITETLTKLYGEAADAYKEINADIIDSNKATERLNKVWAKVGKKAAPIVTTFKEGVAELGEALVDSLDTADVEKFQSSIKRGFSNLSQNVLPKLIKALEWVMDNMGTLASLTAGFIAALAVGKIASFASSIGTTLVTAIKNATSAQKGLNAAASANPYVLLTQAIVALGVAFGGLVQDHLNKVKEEARLTAEAMYGLTDAEKAATDRANEAAEAFNSQRASLQNTINESQSHFAYLGTLKDELFKLADATGKVEEKDRARAEFIINELNEALGTEYKMTGDQIQNYKELATSIDTVMEKKKAEILLNASSEAYAQALKNKAQAEKDYYTTLHSYMDKTAERDVLMQEVKELNREYEEAFFAWEKAEAGERLLAKIEELKVVQESLNGQKDAYNNSKETLQGYYDTIGQYETANIQMLEGNTEEASKILSDLGYYYDEYAADVGYASDEVQNRWEMDAIDAGIKAEHIKENWEKGIDGYTEEQVLEAEKAYEEMLEAYADAHKDAEGVGEDLTAGLGQGMDSKKTSLFSKAKGIVSGIISAFREAADSHSPSRKMIDFGEDMGEGADIGLENKTKDMLSTARKQVRGLLDAYQDEGEEASLQALRGVSTQATSRSSQFLQSFADNNGSKLDKILAAIERGQVLVLDGDAVVGGTADRMNRKLGQDRELVARGAK